MSRLKPIEIDQLNADQKGLLDTIENGPRGRGRSIGMVGPFGVWVRSPGIGTAIQNLGAVARFETDLAEDVKEVAIVTVGAHFKAKFEFGAHRALALAAGVDTRALDAIRDGQTPDFEEESLQLAHLIASELLVAKRILPATYAAAVSTFGEGPLIELVSIIGYYCLVSVTLNAFEIEPAETMTDPWPDLP